MWKSGQSADRSSDFLMEARNLHFCVKCPDFPMLAPLSVFSVLQTKRNASWLPARTLCVASEVTAAPLGGSRRSPQWRAKLGGGARTWADLQRPSKRQPGAARSTPPTPSAPEAFPAFPPKSSASPPVLGWSVPNIECKFCMRPHERGDPS